MIHNGIEYTQIPYAPTYYISRCGKVVRSRNGIVKDISVRVNMDGYSICNIESIGRGGPFSIHRLLANTFISVDISPSSSSYRTHINHIDGNKLNNSLSNLEVIGMDENQRHHQIRNNTLGIGVTYVKRIEKYKAQIQLNNKRKHIGCYDTPQQAHKAYIDAFIRYGFKDKYVEQLPAYKEAIAIRGEGVDVL